MQSNVEQLRQSIDPLTPLYVLVDPMVGEPLPGIGSSAQDPVAQRKEGWERHVIPVPLASNIALPPHQHPYLVELTGPDDPLLDITVELADDERLAAQAGGLDGEGRAAHRIGGWLQSGMREIELADAISAMCRVNTEAPTRATYLRLADRRVLDLLCHVAGERRVAAQFGRIQSWSYISPLGRLRRLSSAQEHGAPLLLSREEWQRMDGGDRLHRTFAKHLGAQAVLEQPSYSFDYGIVEKVLMDAARAAQRWPHRFTSTDDEVAWAALSLLYPTIAQSDSIHQFLADAGSEEAPPEPLRYLHRDLLALV